MSTNRTALWLAFPVVAALCAPAIAQKAQNAPPQDKGDKGTAAAADTYDALYERYLASARAMSMSPTANINWMVNLSADRRARGLNDLVTIHVVENLQASGTADAELNKQSAASAGIPHLFGAE